MNTTHKTGNKTHSVVFTILLHILVVIFFLAGLRVYGQVNEPKIEFVLNPTYPHAYEFTSVTIRSFSFDTQSALFSWSINGKPASTGRGVKSASFTTGPLGSKTAVSVIIVPFEGMKIKKTIDVYASDLDILWTASSYTPPFYRGKSLPTRGSTVTFVASPFFESAQTGKETDFLFEWNVDGKEMRQQSGYGARVFSLNIGRNSNTEYRIQARVTNPATNATQTKSFSLPIYDPALLFYELHPLQGPLTGRAISDRRAIAPDSEIQVLAVPYYASQPPAALDFGWKVENTDIARGEKGERADVLTYHAEQGSRGQQIVSLSILNPFNILERIQESFRIYVE
ncbi:MAG: hypothetical protein G01um101429_157 [Parcubacteria group bacterium Gr01-1014_29]|nr:MAG: hypothetical protein G01um101429_157 [Parcubacteria group bacterium Gr01-1014_29]